MAEFSPSGTNVTDKCEVCLEVSNTQVMAECVCTECDIKMCSTCRTKHTRQAEFSKHQIKPFPMLKLGINCHKHNTKSAKYWCSECKKTVCNICLTGFHDGHKTKPIAEIVTELKQKSIAVLNTKPQLDVNQKQISETIDLLNKELDDTVRATEEYRDKLVQIINTRTDKLLSEVQDKYQSQINNLLSNLQIEDNKINDITKWIQATSAQLVSLSSDNINDIQTSLDEGELLTEQKPLVSEKPKFYQFISEQSLSVGQVVERCSMETSFSDVVAKTTSGHCQMWQGDVEGGNVRDMKFVSGDTICCVQSTSLSLYKSERDVGLFGLLRQDTLDSHDLRGVAVASDSHIYLTCGVKFDGGCGTVHQYDLNTHSLLPYTGQWRKYMIQSPRGIAVNSAGVVAVAARGNNCVFLFHRDGSYLSILGESTLYPPFFSGLMGRSLYVAWDNSGRLVVSDCNYECLFVFDSGGHLSSTIGTRDRSGQAGHQLHYPQGVCVDQYDNILVADYKNGRLSEFDSQGTFVCHPLTDKLHRITKPRFVDIVNQGDKQLLLVGKDIGKINVFTA